MKLLVDTHVHTVSSGHAYSTVKECADVAARKGLKMIAITDHGPAMEGAPTQLHFANLRILPDEINGVKIMKSIEANIIDYDGKIDLGQKYIGRLDFVIASLHDICIEPLYVEQNTFAMIGALKSPYVDAIGHPGNPIFPVDIEKVVLACKEMGKFIEINNNSFKVRKGSRENCIEFALMCKKHEVKIICGSDSHYCEDVGSFDNIIEILKEIDMPNELIMNLSVENFEEYKIRRKNNISLRTNNEI